MCCCHHHQQLHHHRDHQHHHHQQPGRVWEWSSLSSRPGGSSRRPGARHPPLQVSHPHHHYHRHHHRQPLLQVVRHPHPHHHRHPPLHCPLTFASYHSQLNNWPKLSNCDFIFTPVWHSHNISPQASWVLETLNHINHNRADPGEVRRALPEDNRTNRLSHAFRSQIWMSCISFGIKPNVQEHFSRDGENWQEGLLLEINIALCMIWPDLIFVIFFYATAFLGLKIVRQKVCKSETKQHKSILRSKI